MNQDKLLGMLWAPFLADAYVLGGHWVYDTHKLATSGLDLEGLNTPLTSYHHGKKAGDFTHYGDKTLWLLESIVKEKQFLLPAFATLWEEKVKDYDGYIDGATRETKRAIDEGKGILACGSSSQDLSIAGQIAPIIYFYHDDIDTLNENVKLHTLFTHMNRSLLDTSAFIAEVVMAILNGAELEKSIQDISQYHGENVKKWVEKGISFLDKDALEAVQLCGPSCSVEHGLSASIYLLLKYQNNYTQMMQNNLLAGGDSAARGMVLGLIMGASLGFEKIKPTWITQVTHYEKINTLLGQNLPLKKF